MQVILAKSAGFCFGVKRAVEKVYEEAEKSNVPVYTYGPIIHNEEVVADLEKKGSLWAPGTKKHPKRHYGHPFAWRFKGNI